MVQTDPVLTLKAALIAGWGLTGANAKANIQFSNGEFKNTKLNMQIVTRADWEDGHIAKLGGGDGGAQRVLDFLQIIVTVKASTQTDSGRAAARATLWALRQEVKRILFANTTGLADIHVNLPGPGRKFDETRRATKNLSWMYEVECQYDLPA